MFLANLFLIICLFLKQDVEVAIKGHFDAALDTIGVAETERVAISLLKRGGHYMTLQVGEDVVSISMFKKLLTRTLKHCS